MPQQAPPAPAPPAAPVLAPGNVTVNGNPIPATAADIYQAFRAQRRVLGSQMENLQQQRNDISSELQSETITGADRKGLEQRITQIDERMANLDKAIVEADAQVAKAAAVPGAAVDPPPPPRDGPPEEAYVAATFIFIAIFLPLSIAYARRIWRRSTTVVTNIPKELTDRLMRVEQTVESTAIEIERIGEGQRFMTRLFTEGQPLHSLPTSAASAVQAGRPGDIRP